MRRTVLLLLAAIGSTHASAAEPAASITHLYQRYVDVGVLDGKYKASRQAEVAMTLPFMRTEARYRVPDSISFTFEQPYIDRGDGVPIMEAVAADLRGLCSAAGSELKFVPRTGIDEPRAERDIKLLQAKKLYGRFSCPSESQPFDVELQAGRVVTERHLPPATSWTIVLATATPELIEKLRDRVRRNDEAVEEFRRSLKAGMQVAVSASDVPTVRLSAEFKRYENFLRGRKYNVCGLVVDVKDQLVQVQISSGLVYVPASAVRPAKEQVSPGGSLPLDSWESWCLKG